jgi:outer membrane protein assembly factor BamE (lipoprotein component of BamABCDE complex)
MSPAQIAAMRMKSAEDMVIAREFIEMGGDYRKAIEIYQSALVADPDNAALKSALDRAKADRYMTEARLAAVKKGMTEAQVRAVLGTPYHRNVKEYPEKKVSAWFYPTNEANDAAGVYFNAKKEVYEVKFDAIQASKPGAG